MSSGAQPAILNFPTSQDIFSTKVDKGTNIIDNNTIPLTPAYEFFLSYVPEVASINIAGFTEYSGTPGVGQFQPIYSGTNAGLLTFNPFDAGTSVTISYVAFGDIINAENVNSLQTSVDNIEGFLLSGNSFLSKITGGIVNANVGINGDLTLQGNLLSTASGASNVGQQAIPFNEIYSNTVNTNNIISQNNLTLSGSSIDISGDLLPEYSGTFNLGSPSLTWKNLNVDNLNTSITLTSNINITPSSSGSNNLGSAAFPMGSVYADNLIVTNIPSNIDNAFIHKSGDSGIGDLTFNSSSTLNVTNIYGNNGSLQLSGSTNIALQNSLIVDSIDTVPVNPNSYNLGSPASPFGLIYADSLILTNPTPATDYVHRSGDSMYGDLTLLDTNLSVGQSNVIISSGVIVQGTNNTMYGNYTSSFGNSNTLLGAFSSTQGGGNITGGTFSDANGAANQTGALPYDFSISGTTATVYGIKLTHYLSGIFGLFFYNLTGGTNNTLFTASKAITSVNYSSGNTTFTVIGGLDDRTGGFFVDTSKGDSAHTEGRENLSYGIRSHSEGWQTMALGAHSHSEGTSNIAFFGTAHAEGAQNLALGSMTHSEGLGTFAYGDGDHTEGEGTMAGQKSYAFTLPPSGFTITVSGANLSDYDFTHTLLYNINSDWTNNESVIVSNVMYSGGNTTFDINSSLDDVNITTGAFVGIKLNHNAHAEGYHTYALGKYSHAEGNLSQALADYSHSEGTNNIASGTGSHVEGTNNVSFGQYSHVEGHSNFAVGAYSHVQGENNVSQGIGSHAGGKNVTAGGIYSFAHGKDIVSVHDYGFVIGKNAEAVWPGASILCDSDPLGRQAQNAIPDSLLLRFSGSVICTSGTDLVLTDVADGVTKYRIRVSGGSIIAVAY